MADNPANSAVNRDFTFTNTGIKHSLQLPLLSTPERTPIGGLAFDKDAKRVNYSDGVGWKPLAGSGSGLKAVIEQVIIGSVPMHDTGVGIFRASELEISYDQGILSSVDNSLGYTRIYFNTAGSYIINVTIHYDYSPFVPPETTTNNLNIERNLNIWYSLTREHDTNINEVLTSGTFPKYVITDISQYLTISLSNMPILPPGEDVLQMYCNVQIAKI